MESVYKNTWYHSVYDSYYNSISQSQICLTATLYARTLYMLAAGGENKINQTLMKSLNADCLLIETLFECMVQKMNCEIVQQMASSAVDTTPTHYTSVYRIIGFLFFFIFCLFACVLFFQ